MKRRVHGLHRVMFVGAGHAKESEQSVAQQLDDTAPMEADGRTTTIDDDAHHYAPLLGAHLLHQRSRTCHAHRQGGHRAALTQRLDFAAAPDNPRRRTAGAVVSKAGVAGRGPGARRLLAVHSSVR
jgi:hypothetical protein